jgi:transcriptional regulator with AAA-type ATPase domain
MKNFSPEANEAIMKYPRKENIRELRNVAELLLIVADRDTIEKNNWNISQAAREIDTPRSNLYKKLEQYGIKISAGAGEVAALASSEEESGRKVRTPQGRMVANGDSGRPAESATENTPPARARG